MSEEGFKQQVSSLQIARSPVYRHGNIPRGRHQTIDRPVMNQ